MNGFLLEKEAVLIESSLLDYLFKFGLMPHKVTVSIKEHKQKKFLFISLMLGAIKKKNKQIFEDYFFNQFQNKRLPKNMFNKNPVRKSCNNHFTLLLSERVETIKDMNNFYNCVFMPVAELMEVKE